VRRRRRIRQYDDRWHVDARARKLRSDEALSSCVQGEPVVRINIVLGQAVPDGVQHGVRLNRFGPGTLRRHRPQAVMHRQRRYGVDGASGSNVEDAWLLGLLRLQGLLPLLIRILPLLLLLLLMLLLLLLLFLLLLLILTEFILLVRGTAIVSQQLRVTASSSAAAVQGASAVVAAALVLLAVTLPAAQM